MDEYTITLPSGRKTTVQLDEDDAKRYPDAKKKTSQAPKAAKK